MTNGPSSLRRAGDRSACARHRTVWHGPLLRPVQAAALLAVKTSWVYDAVRTGNLPCIRVGRHIRFTRGMLEEWLEDQSGPRRGPQL